MLNDTVNFPFGFSINDVGRWLRISWFMYIVLGIRSEEYGMKGVVQFPVWWEFKAIVDGS